MATVAAATCYLLHHLEPLLSRERHLAYLKEESGRDALPTWSGDRLVVSPGLHELRVQSSTFQLIAYYERLAAKDIATLAGKHLISRQASEPPILCYRLQELSLADSRTGKSWRLSRVHRASDHLILAFGSYKEVYGAVSTTTNEYYTAIHLPCNRWQDARFTLEGLLILLHELGHLIQEYRHPSAPQKLLRLHRYNLDVHYNQPIGRGIAAYILHRERDAWAYALSVLRPFRKSIEQMCNTTNAQFQAYIHRHLTSYSEVVWYVTDLVEISD